MKTIALKNLMLAAILATSASMAQAAASFSTSSTLAPTPTGTYAFFDTGLTGSGSSFNDLLSFTVTAPGDLSAEVLGGGKGSFTFSLFELLSSTSTVLATGNIFAGGTKASFSTFDPSFSATAGNYFLHIVGSGSGAPHYAGSISLTSPVPEPETYGMFLAGLGLMGFVAYRRKNS